MISTGALKALLQEEGASLVGFGDLTGLSENGMDRTVAIAVRLPEETVAGIADGPTRDYFRQYHRINALLDHLAETAAGYLIQQGFRAVAQTTTAVVESVGYRTAMPHKTCATRAGLGWIGKSALLVTPEYGPAVRLTSVLTDAVFDHVAQPIDISRCGACTRCRAACPVGAIRGALWQVGVPRENLVDVVQCRSAARRLAADLLGEKITLCGKCIQVCPYVRRTESGI